MAIRSEDLVPAGPGQIVRFPTARVRARVRRQRRIAVVRRRMATGAVLVVIGAGWLLGGGTGNTAVVSAAGAPQAVVVAQGQTLWELAVTYAPAGVDKRAYVDAVLELNGLSAPPAAGAKISLP
ncbi:MAG: hypothetical protein ACR2KQ_11220 [Actinomycetota bacterium]